MESFNGPSTTRETATGVTGVLRIGLYFSLNAGPHMPAIIETFKTRHPRCDVVFVDTGMNRDYLAVLRAGEVDMLAIRLPLDAPDLLVGPVLSREQRVVVLATRDPLAHRDSISYEDLAGRAYQIELLANLDLVSESGALVIATWPKARRGSGFPARVFAIAPTTSPRPITPVSQPYRTGAIP